MRWAVALAGCGDDKPTAPGADNLDDQLFGSWTVQDEDVGEITFTFEDDGTLKAGVPGIQATGSWSVDGDKLAMILPGGSYRYEISDGELEFTTVTLGGSDLSDYSFTTDGDTATLTGVTWVDGDSDRLVFSSDGTYLWGDVFEEGLWSADGNTVTVSLSNTTRYSISGDVLTLTDDAGGEQVLTKKK